MKLSVVIPAHNEEGCIEKVVLEIIDELKKEGIDNEIVIVNDNSTDLTAQVAEKLAKDHFNVKVVNRTPPNGFGRAVKEGLDNFTGDAVVIAMGDASDDPRDIVRYFRKIEEGYDCVFGSRFMRGAVVKDYPQHKLFVNRLANLFLQCLFMTAHNDLTNAFKAYKREVIEAIKPIESLYFNITIELPLKALIRGYKAAVVPISWYGRESGVSKLKIKEMGRRYLYVSLYLWLQKMLIKDDIRDRKK